MVDGAIAVEEDWTPNANLKQLIHFIEYLNQRTELSEKRQIPDRSRRNPELQWLAG